MYYVYEHSLDGKIFYVGMGKNNRPYDMYFRNNQWKRFVNGRTEDVQVHIILKTDEYNIALQKETEHTLLRINEGYNLCQTRAGKKFRPDITVTITPHTEEHRKHLAESMTGKKETLEHRMNISKALKGRIPHNIGKHWNKELRRYE